MNFKRQAVIVIHGIGEQRPMSVLRSLVGALGVPYSSKPDKLSESYELRRLNIHKTRDDQASTHFYEFYWAHLVSDTGLKHLLTWLFRLLGRPEEDLRKTPPQRFDIVYKRRLVIVTGLLLVALLISIGARFDVSDTLIGTGVAAFALYGLLWLGRRFAMNLIVTIAGDAARYLDPAPDNIRIRHTIRRDGIHLLRSLHHAKESQIASNGCKVDVPLYDRIVVIGHSLGSVIAYDILKHYWAEVNNNLTIPAECARVLRVLEGFQNTGDPSITPDDQRRLPASSIKETRFRDLQSTLFERLDQHRGHWVVSDLISLGSPLSLAPLLFASSVGDFDERIIQRELPTCPPQRSRVENPGSYAWRSQAGEDLHLHHAALFAVTRWTNLYLDGDPLAGALADVFGAGIRDLLLEDGVRWLRFRNHTRYWPIAGQRNGSRRCIEIIRQILDLPEEPNQSMHTAEVGGSEGND